MSVAELKMGGRVAEAIAKKICDDLISSPHVLGKTRVSRVWATVGDSHQDLFWNIESHIWFKKPEDEQPQLRRILFAITNRSVHIGIEDKAFGVPIADPLCIEKCRDFIAEEVWK